MVAASEEYPWSSYRATVGDAPVPACLTIDWILDQFAKTPAIARRRYAAFVAEGIGNRSPWSELKGQTLLGSEKFIKQMAPRLQERSSAREVPKRQRLMHRPTLAHLFADLDTKAKRNQAMARAHLEYGYAQAEIAVALELHYASVSRIIKTVESSMLKYKM
jgi:putative transposase